MPIPPPEPATRPQPAEADTFQVVIIGGGIAGLSTAWYVQTEAMQQALAVRCTVLEQSSRWGGKIWTETVETPDGPSFVLEAGPDAFLTRKPWALQLARALGLEQRLVTTNPANSRTFVLNRGMPMPLPDGLQLLVPTKLLPFLRSPLFTRRGKLRVLLEPFIPPRRTGGDETVADFVRRRLGVEMLHRLGEPLLSGVYNASPEYQSITATFPQFPAHEAQYGSLMRGTSRAKREQPESSTPPFISFVRGTAELVNALISQLTGTLALDSPVSAIQRDGDRYTVRLASGTRLAADAVVLATPASITAGLLRDVAPSAADYAGTIPMASIGTVYLGFRRDDVPHPLNGFGLVIPASEGRRIDGITWTSSKWDCRAPANCVLLRVFFGGPNTRAMMSIDNAALVAAVREELRSILGIDVPPLFHRVYRWQDGYPQYHVGHIERVAALRAALPAGLYVTGSSYGGVGVPDCVRQGQDTAREVVATLAQCQPGIPVRH